MYLPALEMACVGYKEFKLINKEKKTNSGKAKSLPTKWIRADPNVTHYGQKAL